jgi:bifunctional DNA-binding transcriptional regulator/antitoxin component of YhaV-PrlF toxin-antitoxin module
MKDTELKDNAIDHKIVSISDKRQMTIPQKYFKALEFNKEAECILQKNSIIIRPLQKNTGGEFAEQILADLIKQGFSGNDLLIKFKEINSKIPSAIKELIKEADQIAVGKKKGATMSDVFGPEDK